MTLEFTLTLDCGVLGERDVTFRVDYSPGTPDVMYLSNGDPGYPGDPPEVEVLSARIGNTEITPLLDDQDEVYQRLLGKAGELAYDGGDPDADPSEEV